MTKTPDKFEATTFEQLKSEQRDEKQAFTWRDGGAKEQEEEVYNTTSDAEHDPSYDY